MIRTQPRTLNVRIICRAALVLVGATLAACERPTTEIELITPRQDLDKIVAEQIVELVEEESGIEVTLIPPPENDVPVLDALEDGYGDLAFATNNKRFREAIATIIPLYPSILHIATRAPDLPDTMRELLDGSTVYAGPPGSIPRLLAEEYTDDLDLEDEVVIVDELDPTVVDVIITYAPIDRERVMADSTLEGFRMVSLGDPEDIGKGSAVDGAVLLNPRLRPFVIPVGTYGDLTPEPIVTLAVDNLLVAREDLEDAVAYDVFAEILRLRPALFGQRPELFQPLDENVARSNWTFSMHPGAIAYLQRDEPTFIERYSGVGEVLVTVIVALVSGGFAMLRIYRIRRKNRIDKFYLDVIELRDAIGSDASRGQRETAIENIRDLQNRAFDMLVHEKLAADESFRIFIELTNDSIEQIQQMSR